MSVYINSNDVSTGTSYNGRYYFNRQIFGQYKIQDYNFEGDISNWCNLSNNSLYIYPTFDIHNVLGGARIITFGNMNSSSTGDILDWFRAAWNQLVVLWSALSFNYTISYNQDTDRYTTIFSSSTGSGIVAIDYRLPSEASPDPGSSIASLFGWPPDGGGVLFSIPSANFIVSGVNFGVPRYLEVNCPQMRNRLYTSKDTNPSFILTTTDQKVLGQSLYIPLPTSYLDLKIYKAGYEENTYSLTNNFSIILKQI